MPEQYRVRSELLRKLETIAELSPLDNHCLVGALKQGRAGAPEVLVGRYSAAVRRTLRHCLVPRHELDDLTQEVFVRAVRGVHELCEEEKLQSWLRSIAAFVARESLRSRRRKRWLVFCSPWELPHLPAAEAPRTSRAVAAVGAILSTLPREECLAFTLRVVNELRLSELPGELGVSLSTAKRRVARATAHFMEQAACSPSLREWFVEIPGRAPRVRYVAGH